jgi:hypothetical protein
VGFLEVRQQAIEKYGPRALDSVNVSWLCERCGVPVAPPSLIVIGTAPYRDLEGLIRSAVGCGLRGARAEDKVKCGACGKTPKMNHFDYHAYSSASRKDLVVRCFPKGGFRSGARHELLRWDAAGGYAPVAHLTVGENAALARDGCLREAEAMLNVSGVEAALKPLEEALQRTPGDPALLEFVPLLTQAGRTGLASAIAQEHIQRHPEDAAGYFWLAESIIQVVTAGALPPERLAEADQLLRQALQWRSDYPEAAVARCTIRRLGGAAAAAAACYEDVIRRYPANAEAHYNLALMALEANPQMALEHFIAGEALSPQDADYPTGRARACLKLGRLEEARAALRRAEELDPDHPRLNELREKAG